MALYKLHSYHCYNVIKTQRISQRVWSECNQAHKCHRCCRAWSQNEVRYICMCIRDAGTGVSVDTPRLTKGYKGVSLPSKMNIFGNSASRTIFNPLSW